MLWRSQRHRGLWLWTVLFIFESSIFLSLLINRYRLRHFIIIFVSFQIDSIPLFFVCKNSFSIIGSCGWRLWIWKITGYQISLSLLFIPLETHHIFLYSIFRNSCHSFILFPNLLLYLVYFIFFDLLFRGFCRIIEAIGDYHPIKDVQIHIRHE